MVISLCEIPTASSNIYILFFSDWTGCGDTHRLCSNEGMFQACALVWQTAQNGRLHKTGGTYSVSLSELHVPHRQCLAGISNAFSASFTSIWPCFLQFYCTPNKACLLCATPASTDRVQSPGFPKIVYCEHSHWLLLSQAGIRPEHSHPYPLLQLVSAKKKANVPDVLKLKDSP